MSSLSSPAHTAWLEAESLRLLDFARAAVVPDGGFGWLDTKGRTTPGEPQYLYVTGRMTHVWALGTLLGVPGAEALVDHGLAALRERFADPEHGGWFTSLDEHSRPLDDRKASYPQSFVVLAGASASIADRPGAAELLEEALASIDRHYWDEEFGAVSEQWDRAYREPLAYRGLNANMHMLEAYLAAFSATGDPVLLERCVRLASRAVEAARAQDWRLPEHFDVQWAPILDYNSERRDDPFKPYGSTIGHWFEWARLLLLVEAAQVEAGQLPEPWLREAAVSLFDKAVVEGWSVDGRDGFVYTVDWEGRPAVRNRLHWVVAEATAAAATLHAVTGESRYATSFQEWWDYTKARLVDEVDGSWHHELDAQDRPSSVIKKGKADVYHALQATLIPRIPVDPGVARGLRRASEG
ncbi:AGE family epimerase/isomerase [Actinotalea sp.]|uniref:AGE family epimerase/isomerase n=1 Tax=Actinotalea sp. TaxID=1872145 RepID=UPI003565CFB7